MTEPTGDPTGYPLPPQHPPPSSGLMPAQPIGDDGPIPDDEGETE